MTGYVKLFSDILASTVWTESNSTRLVWITMLAMASRDGDVMASVPGLAHMARVTVEECQEALNRLAAPDEHSRTKDHEGRRIEAIDGGWFILNYEKHRERMTLDDRREKDRLRQERKRKRDASRHVTLVTESHTESRSSSAYGVGDGDASGSSDPKKRRSDELPDGFAEFWEAYDYKKKQPDALKAWRKINPDEELRAKIVAQAKATRVANPGREFYAYPATWLNGECWNDEIVPRSVGAPAMHRPGVPVSLDASGVRIAHPERMPVPYNSPMGDCHCEACNAARSRRTAK